MNDLQQILRKENHRHPTKIYVVNEDVSEWDIHAAHAVALGMLKGKSLYDDLMMMLKKERNIRIGKMMRDDTTGTLSTDIADKVVELKTQFCIKNSISVDDILETTKDSLVLHRKSISIPSFNVSIKDSHNIQVDFVRKGSFNLYFREKNTSLFYDGFTADIKVKGYGDSGDSNPFIQGPLKELCQILLSEKISDSAPLKLRKLREKLVSDECDVELWRRPDRSNMLTYLVGESETDSGISLDGLRSLRTNYETIFLPLLRHSQFLS